MHPYLRQAIAESHIEELRHSAERRRLVVGSPASGRVSRVSRPRAERPRPRHPHLLRIFIAAR